MYGLLICLHLIPNIIQIRQNMGVISEAKESWNSTILMGISKTNLPAIRENKTLGMGILISFALCEENQANSKKHIDWA